MKTVAILCGGGTSSEYEVSVNSGQCVYEALRTQLPTEIYVLHEDKIPNKLDPERHVVFPLGHGEFVEDGGLQTQLEAYGFSYLGSDSSTSKLCMDKIATKKIVEELGILTADYLLYQQQSFEDLWDYFRGPFVMKPCAKGSSVGVFKIFKKEDFEPHLEQFSEWSYFAERCIEGKDITAGMLVGKVLPLVKIETKDGFYDYKHKYTLGLTDYLVPAPIPETIANAIRVNSERIFQRMHCRDFARLDYLLQDDGTVYFLEVNTIPGMTKHSLLPKAAACLGIDYVQLCRKMIDLAIQRD